MNISVDKYDNYSLAKISEEKVDTTVAPELKSELLKLHQEGIKSLIVDMSEVKYVDSSGLSAMLVGNRTFSEKGAFVLYEVTDHVMKLITISQLDKVMTVLPTKEEAVDYVFMTEIEKGLSEEEE
jgi:anti-anti-sigma factor